MSDCENGVKRVKETYKLTIKEYDGKEAFWSGKMPYTSFVECSLTAFDLDVTIERIIGTYLPIKYVVGADGSKNLTTERKKRVEMGSPLRAVFGSDAKEATLYIHFGSVFDDRGFHQRNEKYFQEAMKKLNKSFDQPGFWSGAAGTKVKSLMLRLDTELKKPIPNMGVVQDKLFRMNKIMGTSVKEQRKNMSSQNRIKAVSRILFIGLLIAVLIGFLNFAV